MTTKQVTICDACGTEKPLSQVLHEILVNRNENGGWETIDICNDCARAGVQLQYVRGKMIVISSAKQSKEIGE